MALVQIRLPGLGREPRLATAWTSRQLGHTAPSKPLDALRPCGCFGGAQHKCREVLDHLRSIIVFWVVPLVDPRGHS